MNDSFLLDAASKRNQQQLRYNYFHEQDATNQETLVHPLDKIPYSPASSSYYPASSRPINIPPPNSPVSETLSLHPATCPNLGLHSSTFSSQREDDKEFEIGSLPEPPVPWPATMMRRPALKDQSIDMKHVPGLLQNSANVIEDLLFKMDDLNILTEKNKNREMQRWTSAIRQ